MMPTVFAPIVEGHGEVNAFRDLINKIITACGGTTYPIIGNVWRVSRDGIVKPGELEEKAQNAILQAESLPGLPAGTRAKLIVLLDAEDDCPAELGPSLRERLVTRFTYNPISVSFAKHEYESWFIASLETVAELAHIAPDTAIPPDLEEIPGAKEWLRHRMPRGLPYKERQDQVRLTTAIDVPLARSRSQSFDRFCREVERLLSA